MATIHVNQLGFRPDDPLKRAVMPVGPHTRGFLGGMQFQVIEVSEFVQLRLNSPEGLRMLNLREATFEETPLGRFAVCDLSDLTHRGGYQILGEGARSYPFLIYRDAWKRCFRLLLEWYRIAACGEGAAGYHEQCHLDDCRLTSSGEQVDLVGGWHDAGDLRKWTSTMAYVSWRLAEFVEEHGTQLDALDVDPELVWHQLERGAEYLLKTVDSVSHLVWHSVAAAGDNTCNQWTDNVPNSGDERWSETDQPLGTARIYVSAQCALARVLREHNPELARLALASALQVWQAYSTRETGGEEALLDPLLELWRTTGDEAYCTPIAAGFRALLERQVTTARFGQDLLRGYFMRDEMPDFNGGFRGRGGRNLYVHMAKVAQLAKALLWLPAAPDASRWREALVLLLEGLAEPMLQRSPYRAMPASIYARGAGAPGERPLAGELVFRYFGSEAEGNNAELLNTGAALALAARVLGQPKWAAYGQKQLEWIFGFNPDETCMMTGLGYSQAAVFSPYVGQIPGGIINGYLGNDDDYPYLCLNREVSAMNMEYWSVHTASMLRALAMLENEPLS